MNPSKNIFLLDSQINFSEINYLDNNDSQIITFDFDSHDALKKKFCTSFNFRYISFKKRAFRDTKKCLFII